MMQKYELQSWKGKYVSLLIILIPVLISCQTPSAEKTPTTSSRGIIANNTELHEIWRASALLVGSSIDRGAYIALTPHGIVAANERISTSRVRLVSLQTATGLPAWEARYETYVSGFATDQQRLYVATSGHPLQAYDLQTGNLVWSGLNLPDRRSYFLNLQNNILFSYSDHGVIHVFNPETGELLTEEKDDISTSGSYLIMRLNEFDLRQTTAEIFKVHRVTGEVMWRTPLDEDARVVDRFPILAENKLIMAFGQIDLTLSVVDFTTGQRLWRTYTPFVSHAAISGNRVYALRADARLVVFDATTGAEVGYVQFTPAEAPWHTYWVGADEQGRVFVYFSDSQELFALAPKSK